MTCIKNLFAMCIIVFALHIFLTPLQVHAQENPVGLVINGQTLYGLPISPVIDNDRVLVPARIVFENLGANVYWNEDTKTVHVQYHDQNVRLTIGENNIVVNEYPIEIPVPAQIIDNHTMIPVGAVSTNLGFLVAFRDRTVFVDRADYMPPPIIDEDLFPGLADEPTTTAPSDENLSGRYNESAIVATPEPPVLVTLPGSLLQVHYNFADNTLVIPRTSGVPLMAEAVHNNFYHVNRYEIALGVDASQLLASGTMNIGNSLLNSIDVAHGEQGTRLVFNGRQILSLDISEGDSHYIIRVMCPRQRYGRIVIIDPGHGGERPGAVYDDVRAADLNLAITRKLLQLIEADGYIKAYTTRNSDTTVHWSYRYGMSNQIGDLMITIHHNAAYNLEIHGAEAFYLTDAHDEGRSLSNQEFANIVQRNLVAHTNRFDRGIRSGEFIVLRNTEAPSTLVEIGFMSHAAEFETLINPEYQWRAARGLYQALLEAFEYMPPVR